MAETGFRAEQFKPAGRPPRITPVLEADQFLRDAAPTIATVAASTDAIEVDGLMGPVRGPVEELRMTLNQAARWSRVAALATELLPAMLGGEEARTYLVAFQNNAEVRALGGMPGTLGVLTADDGQLTLERTFKPQTLENGKPVLPLTKDEQKLFPPRMAVRLRAMFTPDFPRAAELMSAFWERSGRPPVDGVLSVDPVAMGYLLEYTGPVRMEDGTELTADNAVDVLLRDTYEIPDLLAQDAFFDEAAKAIFEAFTQRGGSVETLLDALAQGVEERRLAVWSNHVHEQLRLEGEDIANELPQATGSPEIGVYVNNYKGDKLSYYLHADVNVEATACTGGQRLVVDVKLKSSVPATGLADYVFGRQLPDLPPRSTRNYVYLYAPAGGQIESVVARKRYAGVQRTDHGSRPVAWTIVDIPPGGSKRLQYVMRAPAGQEGDVHVLSTPLADGTGGESYAPTACQ